MMEYHAPANSGYDFCTRCGICMPAQTTATSECVCVDCFNSTSYVVELMPVEDDPAKPTEDTLGDFLTGKKAKKGGWR